MRSEAAKRKCMSIILHASHTLLLQRERTLLARQERPHLEHFDALLCHVQARSELLLQLSHLILQGRDLLLCKQLHKARLHAGRQPTTQQARLQKAILHGTNLHP